MTDAESTRKQFTAVVKETTPVKMRRAQNVPDDVVNTIISACEKQPQVRACYLLDVMIPDEPENVMLYIMIDVKSEMDVRLAGAAIQNAIAELGGLPQEVFVARLDGLSYNYSMLEPIYRRRSWLKRLLG